MITGTITPRDVERIIDALYEELGTMPKMLPGENRGAYAKRANAISMIDRTALAVDLSQASASLARRLLLECIRKGYYDALEGLTGTNPATRVLEMMSFVGFDSIAPNETRRIASALGSLIALVGDKLDPAEVDEIMAGIVECSVGEGGELSVPSKLKLAQNAALKARRAKKGADSVIQALIAGFVNDEPVDEMVRIIESAGLSLGTEWASPVEVAGKIECNNGKVVITVEIPEGLNPDRFADDLERGLFGSLTQPKKFSTQGVGICVRFPAGSG